jgi:hypothetical protein
MSITGLKASLPNLTSVLTILTVLNMDAGKVWLAVIVLDIAIVLFTVLSRVASF